MKNCATQPLYGPMPETDLIKHRKHWIFDLDGTLTVSAHDFDHMRRALGMAPDTPILEALHAMPADEAAPLWEQLNELEFFYAGKSSLMDGATELLQYLHDQGRRLGSLLEPDVDRRLALNYATECQRLAEAYQSSQS